VKPTDPSHKHDHSTSLRLLVGLPCIAVAALTLIAGHTALQLWQPRVVPSTLGSGVSESPHQVGEASSIRVGEPRMPSSALATSSLGDFDAEERLAEDLSPALVRRLWADSDRRMQIVAIADGPALRLGSRLAILRRLAAESPRRACELAQRILERRGKHDADLQIALYGFFGEHGTKDDLSFLESETPLGVQCREILEDTIVRLEHRTASSSEPSGPSAEATSSTEGRRP
jgi:hypothetical protein